MTTAAKEQKAEESRDGMVHLRIPAEIYKRVKKIAAADQRSVHNWIVKLVSDRVKEVGEK